MSRGWRRGEEDDRKLRPQRPAWPTFKRAAALLWPHRLLLAGYLTMIALTSVVGLIIALLVKQIIDADLPNGDGAALNLHVIAILLISILAGGGMYSGGLAGVLQSYLSNTIGQTVMHDLRGKLFRHLSAQSMTWFTSNRTGETLSRINNDVNAIQGVISDTLGSILGNVITLTTTFAVMLALDWRLALFSIAFVPVFIFPARRVGDIQRSLQRETQQQMGTLSSQMQETLSVSGALLMKTFGRQEEEASRFEATSREIRRLSVRRALTGRWFMLAMGLFGSLGLAVVYWYGGHKVIAGDASLGTVVALASILPRLFGPAASLIGVNVTVLSSLGIFERIFDYLDLQPEIEDRPGAVALEHAQGRVEFRNVDFSYIPGQPVLRNVSFEVPAGHFAALVGPTGAGKTTIAYLVPRLYDIDDGQVCIDGHDVRDVKMSSLAKAVGMVNQEPYLFHSSIRENLRYARPDATDAEVESAARAANIHDFIARLSNGYDTVVGERGYRLSGGEKQRVAIARALLKNPAVLILDEATSSVDTVTERLIQEALHEVTEGRTVIAIAHRLSTILAADVILVIDEGRVVERGTHTELLARNGTYARLYEQQILRNEGLLEVGGS